LLMNFSRDMYEKGYSSLDIMRIYEMSSNVDYEILYEFQCIKKEIRHEPLLMFSMLHLWLCHSSSGNVPIPIPIPHVNS
jgi:hypothetical protein